MLKVPFTRHLPAAVAAMALGAAAPVHAIPVLQLYAEGGVYDDTLESWVFDLSASNTVRLWAIGNVDGPGGQGTISDVKLAAVYDDVTPGVKDADIALAPSTTGGFGGFFDPSVAAAATFVQFDDTGALPQLTGGGSLAPHGVYGAGREWQEFLLGDFALTDSPMADFIDAFPTAPAVASGQISVYEITFSPGLQSVHFDLYDNIVAGNGVRAVFAPFSHDVDGNGNGVDVPEPASAALLGLGLLGLVGGGGLLRRRGGSSAER